MKGRDQFSKNDIDDNENRFNDNDRLEKEKKGFMNADEIKAVYEDVNVNVNVDTNVNENENELNSFKYRVRRIKVASNDNENDDDSVDNMSKKDVCQTFLYLLIVKCLE